MLSNTLTLAFLTEGAAGDCSIPTFSFTDANAVNESFGVINDYSRPTRDQNLDLIPRSTLAASLDILLLKEFQVVTLAFLDHI